MRVSSTPVRMRDWVKADWRNMRSPTATTHKVCATYILPAQVVKVFSIGLTDINVEKRNNKSNIKLRCYPDLWTCLGNWVRC